MSQISELTNSKPTGLEGLSVELETVLGEIKTLQISQDASIQSFQKTYKEHSTESARKSNTVHNIDVLSQAYVLVVDWTNQNVKLLNQQYQVVSHWDVNAWPFEMCLITPSEVAVTVNTITNIHEVQFITVNQGKLVPGRRFQLQHECKGIAYHQGDLFVTSKNCAVSPTGDRLYITNPSLDKLLTLARDGTLLATYTDPALGGRLGQVLVCGCLSHTILQDTLATGERDGHHIIHHCGTLLLSWDNDAEDVGTSMTQKESTSIDIELAKQQHQSGLHTPFNSQPEVNQNSNSALNNIGEASISAQLLSFRNYLIQQIEQALRNLSLIATDLDKLLSNNVNLMPYYPQDAATLNPGLHTFLARSQDYLVNKRPYTHKFKRSEQ
ncbi:hypothetical protein DPMN_043684 [Dreissena polymorpha]|uniref:Uncharacterized protein n=1 Tax=Dreissena polymorpha TaxID=45954 RepID=A0A9D4HY59_DREPO|nr:hypothetical protein DPMN_043684 [Dreissena polymorpha]